MFQAGQKLVRKEDVEVLLITSKGVVVQIINAAGVADVYLVDAQQLERDFIEKIEQITEEGIEEIVAGEGEING